MENGPIAEAQRILNDTVPDALAALAHKDGLSADEVTTEWIQGAFGKRKRHIALEEAEFFLSEIRRRYNADWSTKDLE